MLLVETQMIAFEFEYMRAVFKVEYEIKRYWSVGYTLAGIERRRHFISYICQFGKDAWLIDPVGVCAYLFESLYWRVV